MKVKTKVKTMSSRKMGGALKRNAKRILASLAIRARLTHFALAAAFIALFPSWGYGGTWVPYGPETFVRASGPPTVVIRSLNILNPNTQYTLQVSNSQTVRKPDGDPDDWSKVVLTINGVRIVDRDDFKGASVLNVPIKLLASNQIGVEVRGRKGGTITVQIIGVDNDLPTINTTVSPVPNPSGWNNSNVTVSFICSDKTSGVAFCPLPIVVTKDGANQVVTGTVRDNAGNAATASVTVNLDMTPPLISGAIRPPPNAAGWNNPNVTVSFTCSDPTSGVASCSSPTAITTEGANQLVTGTATDLAGNTATAQITVNITTSVFSIRNYGGKCLDFGPPPQAAGSPVFIYDCNGTEGQQVRVQEINDRHEVILHAGNAVIGINNPPKSGFGGTLSPLPPQTEFALELQHGVSTDRPESANQIFALDGDSIILAANRTLVVQVQNARGANRSPLVAGLRNLADSEFWDFNAIDGSDKDPTSGFVRVGSLGLLDYLRPYPDTSAHIGRGTVIKILPGTVIDLSGLQQLEIPTGVTIRGDRRGTLFGPLLCNGCISGFPDAPDVSMLEIKGDDVRITGLRLQGTSRSTDQGQPLSKGVLVPDGKLEGYLHSIVDHNDISNFTGAGVSAKGDDPDAADPACDPDENPQTRPQNVFVARNFIHHDAMQNVGYGADSSRGGYPLIEGNTFLSNRHAIAADGTPHTGYHAWLNLVLSDAPLQTGYGPFDFYTHDFDMHGTHSDGFGGLGGSYVDIFRNTFLGTNRKNYELRGGPCHDTDFHFNVSLETKGDALNFKTTSTQVIDDIEHINIAYNPNQFEHPNPTAHLGVGDFDGNGVQDLFLATGAAWYYAPAGNAEWRFLSAKTDLIDTLLFGDFDGDGRTDVVGMNGSNLMVSWGGVSDWEVLNPNPCPPPIASCAITDMAVGRFLDHPLGDLREDIFLADGTSWYLSSGGSVPFNRNTVNTSGFRVKDLRFGDFDGDGKTDVFGVEGGGWKVSYSAASGWTPLAVSLTDSVVGLIVADFDGDGRADVAMASNPNVSANGLLISVDSWNWNFSHDGVQGWTSHQITPTNSCSLTFTLQQISLGLLAGVGRFAGAGNTGADLLLWGDGNNFCLVRGGAGAAQRQSRQDMR